MRNFLNDQVFADLRSDFMFKRAFGQKNILISFLNSILKTDRITDVEYRNVEMLGLTKQDRKVFYDIYCHTSDNRDFVVEMQHNPQKYFRDRALYYSTLRGCLIHNLIHAFTLIWLFIGAKIQLYLQKQ